MRSGLIAIVVIFSCSVVWSAPPEDAPRREAAAAKRGYHFLTNKPYLPPDFDQEVFDRLWTVWEEPLREKAAAGSPETRRRMAFARYGLTVPPVGEEVGPAQYVVDASGNWTMNCLACHQGEVAGRVIGGLPNSRYDLSTLTEDVRTVKLRLGRQLGRMDKGSLAMPLGTTIGTTNAVIFGVALMNYRDADLNVHRDRLPPLMIHHDLDSPAWWHFKKKRRLYYDGFVPRSHRALMQFLLVPENGPQKFRQWEEDFRAIAAWIGSLEAPRYPFEIDGDWAARGRPIFNDFCARCHGTYGDRETYPNKLVSLDEVGTDPVRLSALSPRHRRDYAESWFGEYGKHKVEYAPDGYIAPPLDGIWATAPYLHNGSVPTLWHLFHPDERPVIWRRVDAGIPNTPDAYDREKIGLRITMFKEFPEAAASLHQRRQVFDTRKRGKSARGHLFPDQLAPAEKHAVLEYLKTL